MISQTFPLESTISSLSILHPPKEKAPLTLQPSQPIIPQTILRQHAPDRLLQNLATPPLPDQTLHTNLLQTARPRRMAVVFLLLHLLARHQHVGTSGRDHVIPAVGRRVPDRFMLAHEEDGDAGGEAAERRGGG